MANKKTVMQMYEEIRGLCQTDEQRAFIDKRMEITAKKNASGKNAEPTPKQKAKMEHDAVLRELVVNTMVRDTKYSATDLVKMVNHVDIPSTQKMTALLNVLCDENKVSNELTKGRSLYYLSAVSADKE